MSECYSTTGYGAKASLRIETTASSFLALPYHQLERVDFNSENGTDTMIISFLTCIVRVTGKKLHSVACYIAKQETESINVSPTKDKSPPPENSLRHDSARIDKIEIENRDET